jgi:hypothetical protein
VVDTVITGLVADTTPTGTDLIVTVTDVSTTPVNRKVSIAHLLDFIEANGAAPTTFLSSGTLADARVAASNVTQHQAALSITESQISDLQEYFLAADGLEDISNVVIDTPADNEVLAYNTATSEWHNQTAAEAGLAAASHNHATSAITSGTFADALVAESNVTQHEAALTITESQISDLGTYVETSAIGTTVQGYDADTLKADTTDELTAGFTQALSALGTVTTGTTTLIFAVSNIQTLTNGGAFTLAPPSSGNGTIILEITNNSSAGAITTSGFSSVTGDAFTTTDAEIFLCSIVKVGSNSYLNVLAHEDNA